MKLLIDNTTIPFIFTVLATCVGYYASSAAGKLGWSSSELTHGGATSA
jgi:hypothetical protein